MSSSACTTFFAPPSCERSLKATYLQHCVEAGSATKSWCLSNEYRLDGNTRRADLAILNDGRFIGVEFKSQRDTMKRLSGQLDAYLRVFDEVILVVAEKHLAQALCQTPSIVAIFVAKNDGSLSLARQAETGTSHILSNRAMAGNLTKAELSAVVANENPHLSRNQLLALADALPTQTLRCAMQSAFQNRYGATSKQFWRRTTGKTVKVEHLESLSRFAKRRKIWQKHKSQSDRFWADWVKKAHLHFRRDDQSSQSSSVSYFSSGSL